MAKKNSKRKLVGLVSELTGHRTYYTTKNTMNTQEKLSIKKYDPLVNTLFTPKLRKTSVVTKLNLAKVKPHLLTIVIKNHLLNGVVFI